MKTCALIPTFYRPFGLERVLSSLRKYSPGVHICVISEQDDFKANEIAFKYAAQFVKTEKQKQGCTYAWNECLKAVPKFDAYCITADDNEFTENWYDECLKVLHSELNYSGYVGTNDKRKSSIRIMEGSLQPTHYLMTRDFIIEHNGGVACIPHYGADFTDIETALRARRANKFAYAEKSIVLHHWEGKSKPDLGYKLAAQKRIDSKYKFYERKSLGFPDDFEPILKKEKNA